MTDTLDEFLAEDVLPEGILEYFEFCGRHKDQEALYIHLEEKNVVPEEHAGKRLQSKGFYETKHIRDFPLRGTPVILQVKRRRWIDQDTGKYVTRDWNLVATGTKLTQEFADFLKELDRI